MEQKRFDDLTRTLGAASTRRQVLRALAGVAAAFLPAAGRAAPCSKEGEPCGCCRNGLTCTNGTCCPNDRVCNGVCCPSGHTCQDGVCVRSGDGGGIPGGCPAGQANCAGLGCVDLSADPANCSACGVTCASGQGCVGGTCLGLLGFPCTAGPQCASGFCTDGVCCDAACAGQCETCGTAACLAVSGAPIGREPCLGDGSSCGGVCDGINRATCINPGAETVCRAASCADGVESLAVACDGSGSCPTARTNACVPYVCDAAAVACLAGCAADADCVPNTHCDANATCQPDHGIGAPCEGDGDCVSGFCTEGVCCNMRCDRPCDSCLDSGVGICTPSAGACDPGSLCVVNARCQTDGRCRGEPKLCSISHPCRTGACDPENGNCIEVAAHEGDPCGAQNDCHIGTCVDGTCEQTPKLNNTACDVDNRCDTSVCRDGACTVIGETSCFVEGECVAAAHCDPRTGACFDEPEEDGTPCDVDDKCHTSACRSGVCTVIVSTSCFVSDVCVASAHCDPSTGECVEVPKDDGASCGAGQSCCGGDCKNTQTDNRNCGDCDHACAANQPAPDGGCQTGFCFNGACTAQTAICPVGWTPACDSARGPVCLGACPPPPDACHTGPGHPELDGTCSYPPKCGPCETCDPSTGTCSPKVCRACEHCFPDRGGCIDICPSIAGPNLCRIGTSFCDESGQCRSEQKDCGPCAFCDGADGQCKLRNGYDGRSCGTCHACNEAGQCAPLPAGTSCGNCQVCNERGTCDIGPDGTSCGTCRVCSGSVCGFASQGTPCGDGLICDGSGACVCAFPCGPQCCPGGTVSCCVNGNDSQCCYEECVFLPPAGSFCP